MIHTQYKLSFTAASLALNESAKIVSCYGITQDSDTKEYFIVNKYMNKGNLRDYIDNNHIKEELIFKYILPNRSKFLKCLLNPLSIMKIDDSEEIEVRSSINEINLRFELIFKTLKGLIFVHEKGLFHGDLHPGNLLNGTSL